MKYIDKFRVKPGHEIRLADIDPNYSDKDEDKKSSSEKVAKYQQRMDTLQYRLFAEQKRSVLVILQALDAAGKDGVIRHVFGSINPQGCRVAGFKQPTPEELSHDFLWRIEQKTPKRGEIVIFNRSHYENVLVVRVHDLVPKEDWSKCYDQINDFERRLAANGTHILKFFLHISKDEQLERFKDRLDDPERHWKISETDYSERKYWDAYQTAYEEAIQRCNSHDSPWFVIPSNHKWFRNLAISQIITETMENLGIELPPTNVDIENIRKSYCEAADQAKHD